MGGWASETRKAQPPHQPDDLHQPPRSRRGLLLSGGGSSLPSAHGEEDTASGLPAKDTGSRTWGASIGWRRASGMSRQAVASEAHLAPGSHVARRVDSKQKRPLHPRARSLPPDSPTLPSPLSSSRRANEPPMRRMEVAQVTIPQRRAQVKRVVSESVVLPIAGQDRGRPRGQLDPPSWAGRPL